MILVYQKVVNGQTIFGAVTTNNAGTPTQIATACANLVKVMPGAGNPVFLFTTLSKLPSQILAVDFTTAYTVIGDAPTGTVDETAMAAFIATPPSEDVITWKP